MVTELNLGVARVGVQFFVMTGVLPHCCLQEKQHSPASQAVTDGAAVSNKWPCSIHSQLPADCVRCARTAVQPLLCNPQESEN